MLPLQSQAVALGARPVITRRGLLQSLGAAFLAGAAGVDRVLQLAPVMPALPPLEPAALSGDGLTLLDVAQAARDGHAAEIAELLSQNNDALADIRWVRLGEPSCSYEALEIGDNA